MDTEDNQIKKECGDFSRDKEDTESQYSLDDETIFTKAGISGTERCLGARICQTVGSLEKSL